MPTRRQTPQNQRRKPLQSRSQDTVNAILEATAQLLADPSLGPLTTNRIAERAGVSVGSLYQYFPNKDAAVAALVEARGERIASAIAARLAATSDDDVSAAARDIIRTLIDVLGPALSDRRWAELLIARNLFSESRIARIDQVAAVIEARLKLLAGSGDDTSRARAFILTRSILGCVRSAAIEAPGLLGERAFEDELVRLVESLALPR